MDFNRLIWKILAAAGLAISYPASAQFEIVYPDEPVKEGQTLLEWARPPILDHTIAEDDRNDTSTCGAKHEWDLEKAAVACWPILRAVQLFTLADFAAAEPSGDRQANRRQGIAYADQAIEFIGQPQWPLQEYLLIKSLELKQYNLMKLEEWENAEEVSVQLVSAIQSDLFRYDDFRLPWAHQRWGQILLKRDDYEGAKLLLEEGRKVLKGYDPAKNAMKFSDQSEDIIVYAIHLGDFEYAEEKAWAYLDYVRTAPFGFQFGYEAHIDLLLYISARREDKETALPLLEERFTKQRDYDRCNDGYFQFPKVLGPMVLDREIKQILIKGGCSEDLLKEPHTGQIKGLLDRVLPPIQQQASQ
ncbi:MAG: hypothetical protein AAGL10_09220 [Pseudomonadota bacterium]